MVHYSIHYNYLYVIFFWDEQRILQDIDISVGLMQWLFNKISYVQALAHLKGSRGRGSIQCYTFGGEIKNNSILNPLFHSINNDIGTEIIAKGDARF